MKMPTETIHLLPVGFDIHRLTAPLTSDEFDADRVVLVHSTEDDINSDQHQSEADRLVANAFEQTKKNIESLLVDIPVESRTVPSFTDYRQLYSAAYDLLRELSNEGIVHVNVSSIPLSGTSAFVNAEATLSSTVFNDDSDVKTDFPAEYTNRGDRVHTYYVRPEQYVETEIYSLLNDYIPRNLDVIEEYFEDYREVETGVFYGLATPIRRQVTTLQDRLERAEKELQSASPEQRGDDWEANIRRCNELLEEWAQLGPEDPSAGPIQRNLEKK
jgi:hypothetical protein